MTRAFLGLGSNVGNRLANLRKATEELGRRKGIEVLHSSSVYETEPVGEVTEQQDFYNAVLEIETTLDPGALLAACKEIEHELGRDPAALRHGPREIDVDLLLIEGVTMSDQRLVLPHRDLLHRRFVLVPLLELAPELPYHDALAALGDDQRVTPIEPPWR